MFALRGSKAHTWVKCQGYVRMVADCPDSPVYDQVREEGTACHWAIAQRWQGVPIPIGTVAPNNIVITEELHEGIELCLEQLHPFSQRDTVHVEQPLAAPDIHEQCGGTPDAWAAWIEDEITTQYGRQKRGRIQLFDWKFGFRNVDAFENWQLLVYLSAIATYLGLNGIDDQYWEVELIIVQPRCYGVGEQIKQWYFPLHYARGYFNTLRQAARSAMGDSPNLTTGPYCNDCEARHNCPALQQAAAHALETVMRTMPANLPLTQQSEFFRQLDRNIRIMEAMRDGLAAELQFALDEGKLIPGITQGNGRSSLVWKVPPETVVQMGKLFGVEEQLKKPTAVITPTQAKKILDPVTVDSISVRVPGNKHLKLTDENTARKVLGRLENANRI